MDGHDKPAAPSAAEALLQTLVEHGIDYFFANPGTDFPPIIDAFAKAGETGTKVPLAMVVPHENAAVAMAHGVTMVSGKPQAVMVHVNVGTGNTLNCLFDAMRDQIPLLLLAGQSPVTEVGELGSRNRFIHWAQDMFDQAGMVREAVKWDYQLRSPTNVREVIGRAFEIAITSPRGPVYVSLPREPLAAPSPVPANLAAGPVRRVPPAAPHPAPADIETLAGWIAAAERPLIITSSAGRHPADVPALERLVDRFALPVVTFNPRYLNLASSHPMHQGYNPSPLLQEADLVIVLECDVPWVPSLESPVTGARVVQVGEDPTYARYPMRTFPSDLAITTATGPFLEALEAALRLRLATDAPAVRARHARYAQRATAAAEARLRTVEAEAGEAVIRPGWISHCLGQALPTDTITVNEYPLRLENCPRTVPGSYYGLSPAGGLGWGLGAAMGAKLAAPERLVVATLGDGAYVFANPAACHWAARAYDLPILTVVYNNAAYAAVRNATMAMYAQSAAGRQGGRGLADLKPGLDLEKLVEAAGGYGERVEKPGALPAAIARALKAVREEKRQAVLNVVCAY